MSNSTRNNKPLTTEEFIARAKAKHGDKYDYSKSVYTRAKNKLTITCKTHGDFQQEAFSHMSGCGCELCCRRDLSIVFESESRKIHGDSYDYSLVKYNGSLKKVKIICKTHGVFEQKPSSHLMGRRCAKCGSISRTKLKTFPFSEFVEKSKEAHGGIYFYYENEYRGIKSKTKINCKIHGDFYQYAKIHMTGAPCPECIKDGYGFGLSNFSQMCSVKNNGFGVLYLIRCWNDEENFYKVGITSNSVKQRFHNKSSMPYSFSVIRELSLDAAVIYKLEKTIHKLMKKQRYTPKINFGGSKMECFDSIQDGVLVLIDTMSKNDQLQLIV